MHVHIAYIAWPFFDSLGSHYSLAVKSSIIFEMSDFNYLYIHVHIAYVFWAHFVASEATIASKTASEVKFDHRVEIYGPNCIASI